MTLHLIGGSSWLQLIGWLIDRTGWEPSERSIRIGLAVLAAAAAAVFLFILRRADGKKRPADPPGPADHERSE